MGERRNTKISVSRVVCFQSIILSNLLIRSRLEPYLNHMKSGLLHVHSS